MPRDMKACENRKAARAKREFALERRELWQTPVPHESPSGPTSAAIKVRDPAVAEMVELLKATRMFEANEKAIRTYGELEGRAVNDLGKL